MADPAREPDPARGHGPAEHAAEELFRARAARWARRRLDPGAATGLALTVALGLIFAAALGFGLVSAMVTVLCVSVALGTLEYLRRQRLAVLAFLLVVVAGQNLIANTVKELVDRARPPVPHLVPATGFSFPSGHTAAAAATWAAVALVLGRGRPLRVKGLLAAGA